jgi:hypothetical protein
MAKKNMMQSVLLKEVDNESFKNGRSGKWTEKSGDESAPAEFDDFVANMRQNGQLTAVIVRPTGKTRKPYELVAGFRRYEALERIAKEDGNLAESTIKVEIRENLSNFEARKINAIENFGREDLSVADQVWTATQAFNEAVSEQKQEPTDADMGSMLAISQAYAGRLLKVGRNVSPKLVDKWRTASVNPLSLEDMGKVADETDPKKQEELYNSLQAKLDKKKETATKGPGAWVDGACTTCEKIGHMFGTLVLLEQILPDTLTFNADFLGLLAESGMIKFGKKGNDSKAKSRMVGALKRGYKAGQQPREEADETEEAAE